MGYASIIKDETRNFHPAYFALVMATGVIASASGMLHYDRLARCFFLLNNLQYFILLIIFVSRIVFFFPRFSIDLSTHEKGPGFLTFIAASCILGNGYVQLEQSFAPAIFLLVVAFAAWVLLLYSFLAMVILKKEKPSPEQGMNGSWLLIVVSVQSLVILATLLSSRLALNAPVVLFAAFCGWSLGVLWYVVMVTLIIYRLAFFPVNAGEMVPSYWIDSGAAAISTLAGATLTAAITPSDMLYNYVPVIKSVSILLWASASWWLPLLIILETWRHIKIGFSYSPAYWSLVFPLGMYAAASLKLSQAIGVAYPSAFASPFLYIACTGWLFTFAGMLFKMWRIFSKQRASNGVV